MVTQWVKFSAPAYCFCGVSVNVLQFPLISKSMLVGGLAR